MNIMGQIMKDMMNGGYSGNGSTPQQGSPQTRPCWCTAARAKAGAGIVVKVIGRPPEQTVRAVRQQPQQYGPKGGFIRRVAGGTPPELQSSTMIKVEKKPVNLMNDILANMRKR